MGGLCEANNVLLAPNGDDFSMVKESQCESNDLSRLTYNLEDKMILWQFEWGCCTSKVTLSVSPGQEIHLELCTLCNSNYLETDQEGNFCNCCRHISYGLYYWSLQVWDKIILVKKAGAQIDPEVESNYVRVETCTHQLQNINLSMQMTLVNVLAWMKPGWSLTWPSLFFWMHYMVFRRELLEQDYLLQYNTLGLSQVSLLVYMSALVLLQYFSQRNLSFLPCLSRYPGNARLSWCQAPNTLCG